MRLTTNSGVTPPRRGATIRQLVPRTLFQNAI